MIWFGMLNCLKSGHVIFFKKKKGETKKAKHTRKSMKGTYLGGGETKLMSIIPAHETVKQEDSGFEASLGYTGIPCHSEFLTRAHFKMQTKTFIVITILIYLLHSIYFPLMKTSLCWHADVSTESLCSWLLSRDKQCLCSIGDHTVWTLCTSYHAWLTYKHIKSLMSKCQPEGIPCPLRMN